MTQPSPAHPKGLGLGIDAGGTQTRWALAQPSGEILASGSVDGLSALQMSTDTGRGKVRETVTALAREVLAHGRPLRVHAGVTGLGEDGSALRALIAEAFGTERRDVTLVGDVEIAYLATFAPGEGYLVYAGTGTVAAFADESGHLHRIGGRGSIIDDAGGGFWIACTALRHIWRAEDASPESWRKSPMAVEIFSRIGGSEWARSREFVYAGSHNETRGRIGKLALAVAATADADAAARAILSAAGAELARLGKTMIERFGARPISLAGRVATLHPVIRESMRAELPGNTLLGANAVNAHHAAARIAAGSAARKARAQS